MIITNVCLLLEALSIVICLHHLYGEKFRLDIATVCFLSINMIVMTAINYLSLPKVYTMIIYPIFFIYCGARFGFHFMRMIINILLCIVIVGGIQMITAIPFHYLFNIELFVENQLLIVNCFAFVIVSVLVPLFKLKKLSHILLSKGRILFISLFVCFFITLISIVVYKEFTLIELNQGILLFISIVFIFLLVDRLSLYKIKASEAETELKMHKLYGDSFEGLIENIKRKQH